MADRGRPADKWLGDTVRWAWRTRVLTHLGIDLRMRLWQAAEDEAVRVFAANLRDLLLAAPLARAQLLGAEVAATVAGVLALAATAASIALPPSCSTFSAVSVESVCDVAAIPFMDRAGDRPGNCKSRIAYLIPDYVKP